MNVTEVLDMGGASESSKPLAAGDTLKVLKFSVKYVDKIGADVAEITTPEGVRHTYAKSIVGQAKSEYWNDIVKKCVDKDASDGLDVWVLEKQATGSNRMMLTLSMFEPNE